jgi:stage II sporulation protein Q
MKEEKNGASKNNWSSIFKKKWFFPSIYLIVAALLLTVVVWYQSLDNQAKDVQEGPGISDDYTPNRHDEEAESVLDQEEVIKMPIADEDQAEIVTKFYDYDADQEDQKIALIRFNNMIYQSTGIDIASADGEPFAVKASLSGTVTEVKEDPILGNVVIMSHENGVVTYYASLGEIEVKADTKVKQGETIGTAGKNLFGKDNGTHVHFEIRKNGKELNPEAFFNQPMSKLEEAAEKTVENEPVEEDKDMQETDEEADNSMTDPGDSVITP